MADASLSLDDIIKKKKIQPFKNQNNTVKRLGNLPQKSVQTKRNIVTTKNKVVDVRDKINQKKKLQMGDARNKLGQTARQGDARDRLNRGKQGGIASRIGQAGIQTGRKRTTQSSLRSLDASVGLNRPVSRNVPRTQSFQQSPRNDRVQQVHQPRGMRPEVMYESQPRGMRPEVMYDSQPRDMRPEVMQDSYPQDMYDSYPQDRYDSYPQDMNERYPEDMNDRYPEDVMYDSYPEEDMYDTGYPQQVIYRQPQPVMVRPEPIYRPAPVYVDEYDGRINQRETIYVDERGVPIRNRPVYADAPIRRPAEVRVQRQPQPLMSRVQRQPQPLMSTRVTQPRIQQQARPQQQGQKVLVNNLGSTVSGNDMKEIFGTIGKVISCRLIKRGVAEATFMRKQDAVKFVETFHNRLLDGQKMNASLVKSRN